MTWTGRGRQPDWIKSALENGQSKDEFLIVQESE
jgi:DNA-binding protein H-NS